MLDQDTEIRYPAAYDDERAAVMMKTHGCRLVLFFADLSGDGPVLEARIVPLDGDFNPAAVRSIGARLAIYTKYARAAIRLERDDAAAALQVLREVGATRRGLGDEFFRIIASEHRLLVEAGEPHPIKALKDLHHVSMSAASRWVSEARRRGLL